MSGYQVDAGDGWWGKLYDESRRNKVVGQSADQATVEAAVKHDGWNEYHVSRRRSADSLLDQRRAGARLHGGETGIRQAWAHRKFKSTAAAIGWCR